MEEIRNYIIANTNGSVKFHYNDIDTIYFTFYKNEIEIRFNINKYYIENFDYRPSHGNYNDYRYKFTHECYIDWSEMEFKSIDVVGKHECKKRYSIFCDSLDELFDVLKQYFNITEIGKE